MIDRNGMDDDPFLNDPGLFERSPATDPVTERRWCFECPECEFDHREGGKLATDWEIYCPLCAGDKGRAVFLRRWLPDVPSANPNNSGRNSLTKESAAWVACQCCDEFWCVIHGMHAFECPCPSIEQWSEQGLDPYGNNSLDDPSQIPPQ